MKRIFLFLSTIILFSTLVLAQSSVFIYRKDGSVNSYLPGHVQSMYLSKIDADGIVHTDYVTQILNVLGKEVRIELSDIDSIVYNKSGVIIYNYLKSHSEYSTLINLIDDCGLKDYFCEAGSKTLFVADNNSFDNFFKNNIFGVNNYQQLTNDQKQKLVLGSCLEYPMQMGRISRKAECDTIYAKTAYVSNGIEYKVPLFLQKNIDYIGINQRDLEFISGENNTNDFIGSSKLTKEDIFCVNGIIQVVDKPIMLQDVDTELSNTPSLSIFNNMWKTYKASTNFSEYPDNEYYALLAPNNEAITNYFNNYGKLFKDMYKDIDSIPSYILSYLAKFLFNNISTFRPSNLNSLESPYFPTSLSSDNIEGTKITTNSVIFEINKMVIPPSLCSVSAPALLHNNNMNIICWAIDQLGFDAYLNSMDSYYSFIIPTNTAMMRYIDPCSYGATKTVMYQFFYDNDKRTVGAHRFEYDLTTNDIVPDGRRMTDASASLVKNRMNDLMNNLIVVGNIESGNTFYKTKGGGFIKVENAGKEGAMKIYGGLQIEQNTPLTVSTIYDQTNTGNGKAYVVNDAPPLTSKKSVYATLSEDTCYSEFFNLLKGGDPDSSSYNLLVNLVDKKYSCVDYNIRLFDTYNYTVWVPTNESMRALHASGALPNWTDFEAETADKYNGDKNKADSAKYAIKTKILNFLRYHIQDNSVYIGGGEVSGKYETAKLNSANQKFFKLIVNSDNKNMSVTDNLGNIRHVIKEGDHYNKMCREYQYNTTDKELGANNQLYTSSYVVVHLIDGPLFYDKDQLLINY